MKKLIIISTVLLSAIVAQSATFSWTAMNIYDHTGSAKLTATDSVEIFAYAADIADFSLGKVTPNANGIVTATISSQPLPSTLAVGTKYSFYLVLTDGDYSLSTKDLLTSVVATPQENKDVSAAFNSLQAITQNTANWTTAAVPEPTSGLLLLLGMAGLALRRKRA